MKEKFEKLNKLFVEKKYSELIFLIESSFDQKTSRLLNVLAVARLLNNKNQKSFILAINEFKEGYTQEPKSQIGLECLKNYINALVDFYDQKNISDNSLNFLNLFNDALDFLDKAHKHFGYDPKLISATARIYKRLNDIDKTLYYYSILSEKGDLNSTTLSSWIFFNNYTNSWTQKDYFKYSKLLDNCLIKYPEENLIQLKKQNYSKIKIGFFSSHFHRNHSITYFLKTILENYDFNKFEIYLYLNNKFEDEGTKYLQNLVFKFKNIFFLSDVEAINSIRSDNLDFIFDLEGITSSNRITLFKNRLAFKQVSWLGYCNTLGIAEMDYILTDPNLIFSNEAEFYSEKIIYLPNIWNCHSGFNFSRTENITPYVKNNYITFGSFNNFNKINDRVINVWSQILKRVNNSKLILKSSSKVETDRLKNIFKQNSVLEAVKFLDPKKEFKDHLYLYRNIDIALDTFPYNGVTTSFEAIWMGIPVITMRGFNFNSRCGESINKNIRMEKLIANNDKDYISKAINIGNNRTNLLDLRKEIFENSLNSSLFNVKDFAYHFYSTLIKIKD